MSFTGAARWLDIGVRTNGSAAAFTMLAPRQPLIPTPYALYAPSAGTATIASAVSPGVITGAGIQDGAVTAAKVASGQVVKSLNGLSDAVTLSAGANVTLTTNGNSLQLSSSGGATSGWALGGNGGTTSANFLGTTDNHALELRVNGQRALWLYPTTGSPSLIGGYAGNTIEGGVVGATIAGGGNAGGINYVFDSYGAVGGGAGNTAGNNDGLVNGESYATVAGGVNNVASGFSATVAGGEYNQASDFDATIGGGNGNSAIGFGSTIAGGFGNGAGQFSSVAGGDSNNAEADNSSIGGGYGNYAPGLFGTIAGGAVNISSGPYATIGGGTNNTASGISFDSCRWDRKPRCQFPCRGFRRKCQQRTGWRFRNRRRPDQSNRRWRSQRGDWRRL